MTQHNNQQVRIIGGKWRGRKLNFPADKAIRPTSDRIRETVFNWLQSTIVDANCLDAFAGSGALGFEALSRGAKQVTFIDSNIQTIRYLQQVAQQLGAEHSQFFHAQLPNGSLHLNKPFDIIFLDPPFASPLLMQVLAWILKEDLLDTSGMLYLESSIDIQLDDFIEYRAKKSGQVYYKLLTLK
ncbi:MAG: 16S rRNA (guanine(966)-N(2))-methyltransferase RsmD [Legionellales bacterium]|nr:16S rRNA (guanine(966)-N(2))-methyltransferase RsmD [Legionellales bacterium]